MNFRVPPCCRDRLTGHKLLQSFEFWHARPQWIRKA
jgi:hypothetical protein